MSKISKNAPVTLTGAVYDRQDIPEDDPTSWVDLEPARGDEAEDMITEFAGEKFAIVHIPFERGDVALYSRLDAAGRAARAGGHSNYGYSGYFKASVFDGKKWRAFKILSSVPEIDRNYASQGEKPKVQARLTERVESWAGRVVAWGNRAYELVPQDDRSLQRPLGAENNRVD